MTENDMSARGGGSSRWIWVALAVAVAGVLIAKNAGEKATPETGSPSVTETKNAKTPPPKLSAQKKTLPRLVDLGATQCIPCKMMAPILEGLKKTHAGKLDVVFIDVWEHTEAGQEYGVDRIPTQIFFDAQGKELFRHEGFFSREDILAKWKEFGVDLTK